MSTEHRIELWEEDERCGFECSCGRGGSADDPWKLDTLIDAHVKPGDHVIYVSHS